jgi:hypothetical protein
MAQSKGKTRTAVRQTVKAVAKKSAQTQKAVAKRLATGRKVVVKKSAASRGATKKPAASAKRLSWLDDQAQTPVIDRYARQLGSFLAALADGKVDESEVRSQEARLVKLMKEVEPQLAAPLHEKVTRLLCELTAYDIMQMLYAMQQARPRTTFQG